MVEGEEKDTIKTRLPVASDRASIHVAFPDRRSQTAASTGSQQITIHPKRPSKSGFALAASSTLRAVTLPKSRNLKDRSERKRLLKSIRGGRGERNVSVSGT